MKHIYLKAVLSALVVVIFTMASGFLGDAGPAYASDTSGTSGSTSSTSAGTTTPSPTPTVTTTTAGPKISWNSAADGITGIQIKYTTEELVVTSSKKLYYAILKKSSDQGVKQAELIPAANGGSGTTYYIDFSTISASKECYIGLSTTLTAGKDGLVPATNVTITPTQRKIVFNVDWSVEGEEAKNNRVLSNVEVTDANGSTIKYVRGTSTQENEKSIETLAIQWRKGSNTAWQSTSVLTSAKWESMKTGGAVVYFRLDAKDSGTATPTNTSASIDAGYRYGKENKIKMSVTRASAVKLDVSKLTLSLKNGTQFRVSGNKDWITVLPYNASSTKTDSAIRSTTDKTTFDPNKENTQVKKSYLGIDEIKTALGTTLPAADKPAVLETRIAATPKKSPSRISTITIPVQSEAPKASIALTEKQWTISGLTAADTTAPANFEYAIVKKTDVTDKKLDMAMIKWSSVKDGTGLKDSLKSTYTTLDGTRRNVNITDTDAVVLIRRRGVAGSSKAEAVLASKYLVLDIPRTASAGTPTPVPTGSATPTPTPSGTVTTTPAP